jgi:hypothetical protein
LVTHLLLVGCSLKYNKPTSYQGEALRQHKTIAILPCDLYWHWYSSEMTNWWEDKQHNSYLLYDKQSFDYQQRLYNEMIKQTNDKVQIQSIICTKQLLDSAGISVKSIHYLFNRSPSYDSLTNSRQKDSLLLATQKDSVIRKLVEVLQVDAVLYSEAKPTSHNLFYVTLIVPLQMLAAVLSGGDSGIVSGNSDGGLYFEVKIYDKQETNLFSATAEVNVSLCSSYSMRKCIRRVVKKMPYYKNK